MKEPTTRNEQTLLPILDKFSEMLDTEDYTMDLEGGRTLEILGSRLFFNPYQRTMDFGVKKTNVSYAEREIKWYEDQDLRVCPTMKDVKIWNAIASSKGLINSNYGYLIYSEANGSQYEHCLERLRANPSTKRALMIYTRPSIWEDFKTDGMNDFICTDGVQCSIKNDRLYYMVKQRSCDMVYGLFNDLFWHQHVYRKLVADLNAEYKLVGGSIVYFPFNLHVYEKHFSMIKPMAEYVRSTYENAN